MSETMYERSRTAFLGHFPELAETVGQESPFVETICEDGVPADVRVGDRRLYGGEARRLSDDEVTRYFQNPVRFGIRNPQEAGLASPVGARMLRRMENEVRSFGDARFFKLPVADDVFLVVLGIGLGYHLQRLIEETRARWVILAEPIPELLPESFRAIDWATLLEDAAARGIDIRITVESDPDRLASWIVDEIDRTGIGFIDGSYVFLHYPLWTLQEARTRLFDSVDQRFIARGFFEDELVMMRNTLGNLAHNSGHLVEGRPHLRCLEPVFIVGSGRSLDPAIDTIRKWRDRVVLISCGTATRVLMRKGIVPDIHTELENGEWVVENIERMAAEHDLSGITLFASTTVDARAAGHFDRTFFFFRDTVSSTRLLAGAHAPIFGPAPTVANTSLAVAATLGFTEFYLFGVDCGVLPGGEHHARDTIYYDVAEYQKIASSLRFPLEVPANFGGPARVDWVFDVSRGLLSSVIAHRNVTVYNCSDGSRIERAIPRLPETVVIDSVPIDRTQVIDAVGSRTRHFRPGELLAGFDLRRIASDVEAFEADLHATIDAGAAGGTFATLYRSIIEFMGELPGRYGDCWCIPIGSIRSLPRIGMYYGHRLESVAYRERLLASFVAEFHAICGEICEATRDLLTKAADDLERISAAQPAA